MAGRVLWFDALIGNVDRTRRNPNLLRWHGQLYLIDHGSSLTFHYNWPFLDKHAERPFSADGYVLRAVPRVDRGVAINVGVLLYSRPYRFLACRIALDADRLRALDPTVDVTEVECALPAVEKVCDGSASGLGDDIGKLFHWLTAPRSTVVQAWPVHTGVTDNPSAELERLTRRLVLPLA